MLDGSIPPGWYPDSESAERERWWDGGGWSSHTRIAPVSDPEPDPLQPRGPLTSATSAGAAPAADAAVRPVDAELQPSPGRRIRALIGLGVFVLVAAGVGAALLLFGLGDAQAPPEVAAAGAVSDPDDSGETPPEELPEPEEMDEDEQAVPEPEPLEVDLRSVDWSGSTWMTTCAGTEEEPFQSSVPVPVTLSPSGPDDLIGWEHRNPFDTGVGLPRYQVDIEEVAYGDVTGDGLQDATFSTFCTPGNAVIHNLEVWVGGTDPEQLPVVVSFTKDRRIEAFEPVDGRLRVTTSEAEPGDDQPWLNGYPVTVVTDYRWSDGTWAATEVERSATASPAELTGGGFQTPTGNIVCRYVVFDGIDDLICAIGSGLSPQPAEPSEGCVRWDALIIGRSGSADYTCDVDGFTADPQPTLQYGERWSNHGVSCQSTEIGLTCANKVGGSLFLSRASWRAS